jgi:hypothetical protein
MFLFQFCQSFLGHLGRVRHFHYVWRLLLRRTRLHDQEVRCRLRLHPRDPRTSGGLRPALDRVHHRPALHRGHPVFDLRAVHHQTAISGMLTAGIVIKIVGCK